MRKFKLNNGVEMPSVGYGTWRNPGGQNCVDAVKTTLEYGYRHIDTAAAYNNEHSVGKAIKESGVKREEIFVTSKLHNNNHTYEKTLSAFDKTLNELQLDYLDLYLIHWPIPIAYKDCWEEANNQTWQAFEKLYNEGKIKAIGVSNFLVHHLEPLMKNATIMPMVNQIEINPGFMQKEVTDFCKKHNIVVEAWAPFAVGEVFKLPHILELSEKYQRPMSQIVIRWFLQNGIAPLPKSVTPERIKENINVFDFFLSLEDMEIINKTSQNISSGRNPDDIDF